MTDLAIQLHEGSRRLDAIDRKILTVLQDDASLSVAEIGVTRPAICTMCSVSMPSCASLSKM